MSDNSKALKIWTIIALVVFILSFVPYLIILGFGIDAAVNGFTFSATNTRYGSEAFASAVLFIVYLFYPIPLFSLAYQICWLVRKKCKAVPLKKYILIWAGIYAAMIVIICTIGVPWLDMI